MTRSGWSTFPRTAILIKNKSHELSGKIMHCDDRRTISALKNNIAESTLELAELAKEQRKETDESRKSQIQAKISELERFIMENKEQIGAAG